MLACFMLFSFSVWFVSFSLFLVYVIVSYCIGCYVFVIFIVIVFVDTLLHFILRHVTVC